MCVCVCLCLRPYVELMNFLLKCREDVRLWVGQQLRGQCEQYWGTLCSSFGGGGGGCALNQTETLQNATVPPSMTPRPLKQPVAAAQPDKSGTHRMDNGTEPGLQVSEKANVSVS